MLNLDVFRTDAFSVQTLTAAILKAPYKPARISALGLFGEKGVATTTVSVEEKNGQLSLILTSPRGAPTVNPVVRGLRTDRSFKVPHLAREATIYADEIQNIRVFGAVDMAAVELETLQAVVNERLGYLRAMHEVSLEYQRLGAIKGTILDADGSTLFNLFTEFSVTQQTQAMALTTSTTDVRGKCVAIARQVEGELGAAIYTGLRGFCSATFFDALVSHASVVTSLQYQESAQLRADLRRGPQYGGANVRNGFDFGGIVWEEFRGVVNKPDGSGTVQFIADDEAYVFPEGAVTEDGPLFRTFFAPADFIEAANTIGLPLYAKVGQDPDGLNRFVKIHAQSNPLSLCLRPRSVVKCSKV